MTFCRFLARGFSLASESDCRTASKVSIFGVFLVHIFHIRTEYGEIVHISPIQSECGKIRARKCLSLFMITGK